MSSIINKIPITCYSRPRFNKVSFGKYRPVLQYALGLSLTTSGILCTQRGCCSLGSIQRLREVCGLHKSGVTRSVGTVKVAVGSRSHRRVLPSLRHQPTRRSHNSRDDVDKVERIHQCLPIEAANRFIWLSWLMLLSCAIPHAVLGRIVVLWCPAFTALRLQDLSQRILIMALRPTRVTVGIIYRLGAQPVRLVGICENV